MHFDASPSCSNVLPQRKRPVCGWAHFHHLILSQDIKQGKRIIPGMIGNNGWVMRKARWKSSPKATKSSMMRRSTHSGKVEANKLHIPPPIEWPMQMLLFRPKCSCVSEYGSYSLACHMQYAFPCKLLLDPLVKDMPVSTVHTYFLVPQSNLPGYKFDKRTDVQFGNIPVSFWWGRDRRWWCSSYQVHTSGIIRAQEDQRR